MPPTPNYLADRFVELWNSTNPDIRRRRLLDLYAPDAVYVFYRKDPIHGREAILDQVAYTCGLYQPMGFRFRSSNNAVGHHNLARINWTMVRPDGEMEMAGEDVLVLDWDGRIRADYQFHDRLPTSFAYNDGYETDGVASRPARPTATVRAATADPAAAPPTAAPAGNGATASR